jgi:alpha-beta hydrolase superfamily lysophospholipase
VVITEINLTPTASLFEIEKSGQKISARSWGTAADCTAVALLVHGLGAHAGWFEAFARQLKIRRLCAIAYDQLGFGARRQQRFTSFNQWIDDLIAVFDYLKANVPDRPIYIMGNSMGGLVAVAAAEHINPDGLVLFSPGFDGHKETFSTMYRLKSIMTALATPEKEIALPYDVELFARDRAVQEWVKADPERRFNVKGKMMLELLKLSMLVRRKRKQVSAPVLMIGAGYDKIVDSDAYNLYFNQLSAPDKKLRQFPDAWHDLMFDPQVDEVADEVVHWMSEHTVEKLISS